MSDADAILECPEHVNAAPYVLGALEEDEFNSYREHLRSCAGCRAEVAELQLVAERLPETVPGAVASSELRARVMMSVRSEAELLNAAGLDADRPQQPASRWRSRRFSLVTTGVGLATTAAVAVLIALSVGSSPSEQVRRGTAPPGAQAALHRVGDRGDLVVAGMAPPALGRIYEVWFKRGPSGAAQPTDALFSVTSQGSASVHVPDSLHGVTQVMVTNEPDGGSVHPTTKALIEVSL